MKFQLRNGYERATFMVGSVYERLAFMVGSVFITPSLIACNVDKWLNSLDLLYMK